MKAFFAAQAAAHPAMQPQDALKMAYQAAFGAEHLGADPQYAQALLHKELAACAADAAAPQREDLAPDVCRVSLAAWKARALPERWLLRLFLHSCAPRADGPARFAAALDALDALAAAGALPFAAAEWQAARQAYLAKGVRPLHHSAHYRAAEAPAYRVVDARFARMLPLLERLKSDQPQIVALDGRAASGKTTLAQDLAAVADAGVIHMDDFFLPAALRTPERLRTPGGNVHYERVLTDVLPRLRQGEAFAYPRFDCGVMALRGERAVPAAAIRIVEGAYSCHPALGDYMTLRAFSNVSPDEQRRRILLRNGEAAWENFRQRWIPLEEAYFAAYNVREKADVVV